MEQDAGYAFDWERRTEHIGAGDFWLGDGKDVRAGHHWRTGECRTRQGPVVGHARRAGWSHHNLQTGHTDTQSGLHSEACDIDYKLHAIIASRKRCVIQSIQEETATNIYYPTPLVGVLNPPQPGSQPAGYRNLGMGPVTMQTTANVPMHNMPMAGGMGGGMNMGMNMGGHHAGGGMNMGMGGMNAGYGQHHLQPNRNQPAIYNPHQHVQFPYQPQPMDINPQTTRGMPYTGPGVHHFSPGPAPMHGNPHGHGQMSVNHTGMSQMSQMSHMTGGYQSRMTSPMPMHMSPNPGMQHHGGPNHGHHGHMGNHGQHHGPQMGHGGGHHMQMGQGQPGMSMGMNMPYQGQTHMHVGLGGGPMGMQNGMGMGMQMGGGMNMNNGGPYTSGPHPGLNVHSGEQGMLGKSNQVWITGEFFGVQRARDMLLNVAVQKVICRGVCIAIEADHLEQARHLSRYGHSPAKTRLATY